MNGKAAALHWIGRQFTNRTNDVIAGVMAHLRNDNAKEVLGPALSHLIGRGSLKAIVTVAIYADVLRTARDVLMADGSISDAELNESSGMLSVLAAAFAKLRNEYAAYAELTPATSRAFIATYQSDTGLFGHANNLTKWAGVELCRNIKTQCADAGPLNAFGQCLIEWADAMASAGSVGNVERSYIMNLRTLVGTQGGEQAETKQTKQCPYCAETIMAQAIKCRYCGSTLDDAAKPSPSSLSGQGSSTLADSPIIQQTAFIPLPDETILMQGRNAYISKDTKDALQPSVTASIYVTSRRLVACPLNQSAWVVLGTVGGGLAAFIFVAVSMLGAILFFAVFLVCLAYLMRAQPAARTMAFQILWEDVASIRKSRFRSAETLVVVDKRGAEHTFAFRSEPEAWYTAIRMATKRDW